MRPEAAAREDLGRRGRTPIIAVRGAGSGRVSIAGPTCYRLGHRSRLIYRLPRRDRPDHSPAVSPNPDITHPSSEAAIAAIAESPGRGSGTGVAPLLADSAPKGLGASDGVTGLGGVPPPEHVPKQCRCFHESLPFRRDGNVRLPGAVPGYSAAKFFFSSAAASPSPHAVGTNTARQQAPELSPAQTS